VPVLEAPPFADAARAVSSLRCSSLPEHTGGRRLTCIAQLGQGYTYCVARTGVTGAERAMELDHGDLLATLDRHLAPPPILGFGISTPDHVRQALAAGAAGVISGSAIVKLVEAGDLAAVRSFVTDMKAATLS
jgi:tryptophan synthase alpha chain